MTYKLNTEQMVAITSKAPRLYIEAGPGTGKTEVLANRLGWHGADPKIFSMTNKKLIACSFTKAATQELQGRVKYLWGYTTVEQVKFCTVDQLLLEVFHYLFERNLFSWVRENGEWPEIYDSWNETIPGNSSAQPIKMCLDDERAFNITLAEEKGAEFNLPSLTARGRAICQGKITHDELRSALHCLMRDIFFKAHIISYLQAHIGALFVDEVFDANVVDLDFIKLVVEAEIPVTLIGDPWQGIYEFRGAVPQLITDFVKHTKFNCVTLTQSYRWCTIDQENLAVAARAGKPLRFLINEQLSEDLRPVEVMLAFKWDALWNISNLVLPLNFTKKAHTVESSLVLLVLEKACTLKLGAAYSVNCTSARAQLFSSTLMENYYTNLATELFAIMLNSTKLVEFHKLTRKHLMGAAMPDGVVPSFNLNDITIYLGKIYKRVKEQSVVIPGLTVHQAKGREWGYVGIVGGAYCSGKVNQGLDMSIDDDRKIYVACTRAKRGTYLVT